METKSDKLTLLPCFDFPEAAEVCRRDLKIPRERAITLGTSAVEACDRGYYFDESGAKVDWGQLVMGACFDARSISPDFPLPMPSRTPFHETAVQVRNETTLSACFRLLEQGVRPLALNFANGVHPGGGFLHGALAQEETLCRSSALFMTIKNDPMYAAHAERPLPDSTDWAILSRGVPVFRRDDGSALTKPVLVDFITCAAPYAPGVGQPESGNLLRRRISRVLRIAFVFGHSTLVLGAWGCGAFGNDPPRTAKDFREALETEFAGAFSRIVFAIADWSSERRVLGPFRDVFAAENASL